MAKSTTYKINNIAIKTASILFFTMLCLFCFYGCSKNNSSITEITDNNEGSLTFKYNQNVAQPNVLLIIADDMGMDATPYSNLSSTKPSMPVLQQLQENGIRFNNAWAYPRCTPTRSSILTGKLPRATQTLAPTDVLATTETTLHSTLNGYATALIGKWHLSKTSRFIEGMGIDHYKGNTGSGLDDYYNWTLHEDTNTTDINNYYGTTAYTDYALDWINNQNQPWFCWLAYNAAHSTFHTPKDKNLYTHQGTSELDQYIQMIEAMDTEMGRLLDNIDSEELKNTVIIFIGDNGTPGQVVQAPFSNTTAKGSLYNGGVNIPLIVAGANVTRTNETDDSLIQSTDLFATIADICGVLTNEPESISFKNLLTQKENHSRQYSFSEGAANGRSFGGFTVRNDTYKYTYNEDSDTHLLFNVATNYAETINLNDGDLNTEEQNALNALQAEGLRLRN